MVLVLQADNMIEIKNVKKTYVSGEVETQALAHKHGLRLVEVPVEMRQRQAGESSIRLWGSTYYVIKVTLALVIGMFRTSVAIPEEGDRG